MPTITYYVVLPFVRADDGTLVPDEGIEAQNEHQARPAISSHT
ncbi:hypothetical protein [Starkeya sp. ORNL1]|nr:hypothetical protein [Starkeya sp. ORNL1]